MSLNVDSLKFLTRRADLLVIAMGALLFIPALGAFGLWDPWELDGADVVREMVEGGSWITPQVNGRVFAKPILPYWIMAASCKAFGLNEWAIRLPLALCAILGLYLILLMARRFFGDRTAFIAAAVLATSPLYFFQARQLISEMIPTVMTTGALVFYAFVVMEEERARHRDVLLFWAFLGLAFLSRGLFAVAMPLLAMIIHGAATGSWSRMRRLVEWDGIALGLFIALPWAVAVLVQNGVHYAGQFFLFDATTSPLAADKLSFQFYFKRVALGTLPWCIVLPFAMAQLISPVQDDDDEGHRSLGVLLVSWAFAFLFVGALVSVRYHHYTYLGTPALALIAAAFFHRLPQGVGSKRILVLSVVVIGAIFIRDLLLEPEIILDVYVHGSKITYPKDVNPRLVFGTLLVLWTAISAVALGFWKIRNLDLALVGISAVLALFIIHPFTMEVSNTLSQRALFDTFHKARKPGELMGLYRVPSRAAAYYLDGQQPKELRSRTDFMSFYKSSGRSFSLIDRASLAQLDTAVSKEVGNHMHVLDKRSSRFLLVSNQLRQGEEDQNPLVRYVTKEKPAIQHPMEVNLQNVITFMGYNVDNPTPGKGDDFTVTYVFRSDHELRQSYKVFVHIDGMGNRLNGDHTPIDDLYPTNYWIPGTYIQDPQTLTVPRYYSSGVYTIWMGLFLGETRLKVQGSNRSDGADRIRVGVIQVK